MIEINDPRVGHYAEVIHREREAAAKIESEAIRELHLRIAKMYEREIERICAPS